MPTEYIESMELKDMAEKLVDRYNMYIGHIDINNIFFASLEGERPKKAPVIFISGVGSQWVRQVIGKISDGTLYCVAVWQEDWGEIWPAKQEWLLFDCLLAIDQKNDGTLKKHDCNEWAMMVEYLGPYWRLKGSGELPSLLDSPKPLPLPMPLVEDEDE